MGKETITMKETAANIVVIGASGHAKVVIDVIEKQGKYQVAGLIDSLKPAGESVYGYEILGAEDKLAALFANGDIYGGVVSLMGKLSSDLVVVKGRFVLPRFKFGTAIHHSAQVVCGGSHVDGFPV